MVFEYKRPTTVWITAQVRDKWYKPKREVELVYQLDNVQDGSGLVGSINLNEYCKNKVKGYVPYTASLTKVTETKYLELTDKQYQGVLYYKMWGEVKDLTAVARTLNQNSKRLLADYINGAKDVDIKVIEEENTMEYLELTQEQRDAVVSFKKSSEWPVSALMARKNDNQYIPGTDKVRTLVSKLSGNKERLLLRYLGNDERVGIKVVNPVKTFYYEAGEKVILNGRQVTLTKDTIVEFKGE